MPRRVRQLLGCVVALALGHGPEFANAQTSHAQGSCETYPETGGYCSLFGLGGKSVYLYDGLTFAGTDAQVEGIFGTIERSAQTVASEVCFFAFKRTLCLTNYPLCNDEGIPKRPCKSLCEQVQSDCADVISLASGVGLDHMVYDCDATVGDPSSLSTGVYVNHLDTWDGDAGFKEETYTEGGNDLTCVGSEDGLACRAKVCAEPFIARRYPIEKGGPTVEYLNPDDWDFCVDMDNAMDCERCFETCELPCPYPLIFSDVQYVLLWVCQWLPGLVGFPLIIIVAKHELKKIKKQKQRVGIDKLPVMMASIEILLLFAIDTLPSLIAKEDLRCSGSPTFSYFANIEGNSFCTIGMLRVHLVQSLLACVLCTLWKVYRQLGASLHLRKYQPGKALKNGFIFLIFVFPGTLAILDLTLQQDQLYEASLAHRSAAGGAPDDVGLHVPNNIRFAFSCGPKFHSVVTEIFIVQGPMLALGVAAMVVSAKLYGVLRKMNYSSGGSSGLRKLGRNMIRFARISSFLVVLNALSTLLFLPGAEEFARLQVEWTICVLTGFNQVTGVTGNASDTSLAASQGLCGEVKDFAPSFTQLFLLTASLSLPTLAFAFVFAVPIIRNKKKTRTSVKPTGTATSSAASSAASSADM